MSEHDQSNPTLVMLVLVVETWRLKHLQQLFTVEIVAVADGFLHHIACEFVEREVDEVSFNRGQHCILLFHRSVLHDVLHDVVPELTLTQRNNHLQQLLEDQLELVSLAILQELLDDATAVGMERQFIDLPQQCSYVSDDLIDDAFRLDWCTTFEAFLDHVVAVLILHHVDDIVLQFEDESVLLLVDISQVVQSLLDDTAPKRIVGELTNFALNDLKDSLLMFVQSHFEYLLKDVVPKLILYETECILHKFLKDGLFILFGGSFNPILHSARTIPIAGHFVYKWEHLLTIECNHFSAVAAVVHFVGHVHHLHGVWVGIVLLLHHRGNHHWYSTSPEGILRKFVGEWW